MIDIDLSSPNSSVKLRKPKEIKFLVFHYTGMQSKRASIKRLMSLKHKVSCHYLVDRNGQVTRMVSDLKVAWHAGKSKWKKITNLNENSIGIELVNRGHDYGYEKFPKKQILKLIKISLALKKKYKIKNSCVLGHSDIAPLRKIDPGEKFPWNILSKKKLGIFYRKKDLQFKFTDKNKFRKLFFKNIYKIGYRYFNKNRASKSDKFVVEAFQRRYMPSKITGEIDQKTLKISHYLAKKM